MQKKVNLNIHDKQIDELKLDEKDLQINDLKKVSSFLFLLMSLALS